MVKHKSLLIDSLAKELVTNFLEPAVAQNVVDESLHHVIHILDNYKCLDVNSHAVRRMLDGIILKMRVHGYQDKASKLNKIAHKLLSSKTLVERGDLKWGLLSFILQLGKHPARSDCKEERVTPAADENLSQDDSIAKELMLSQYSDQDETLSEWSEDDMRTSFLGSEFNVDLDNCESSFYSDCPHLLYKEEATDSWLHNNLQNYWCHMEDKSSISEYAIARECLWSLIYPAGGFVFVQSNEGDLALGTSTPFNISQQSMNLVLRPVLTGINNMKCINDWLEVRTVLFVSSILDSYARGLTAWRSDIMQQLISIERLVSKEENKSLIWLTHQLEPLLKTISVVHRIHQQTFASKNTDLPPGLRLLSILIQTLDSPIEKIDKRNVYNLLICSLRHHFQFLESWLSNKNVSTFSHFEDFGVSEKSLSGKRKNLEESFYNEEDAIEKLPGLKFLVAVRPTLINILDLHGIIKSIDTNYQFEEYVTNIEDAIHNKLTEPNNSNGTLYRSELANGALPADSPTRNFEKLYNFSDPFMEKAFEGDVTAIEKKPSAAPSHESDDADCAPGSLECVLTEVLSSLVDCHFEKVGRDFMSLLVNQYQSQNHVQVFKSVMLMEAGDVVREFYSYLFDKVNNNEVLEVLDITARLRYCVDGRYPDFASNFTVKLSKSAGDRSTGESDWFTADMSSIYINYEVGRPISLIINDETIKLYNKLFAFCLNLKRSASAIENLSFKDLGRHPSSIEDDDANCRSETGGDSGISSNLSGRFHRLFLLRHWLLFFARTIHDHFNTTIIMALSHKIDRLWDNNLTPLQFLKEHVDALKYTCAQCFLSDDTQSPIQIAISGAFSIIEEVRILWHGPPQRITDAKLSELEDLYATCHRCLTRLLTFISERQSMPHVEALMDTLANSFPM